MNQPKKTTDWRAKIHEVIYGTHTPAGKLFDIVLLVAILYSIIIVMLESVQSFDKKYHDFFNISEWTVTILFTIEYILRIISVKNPKKYRTRLKELFRKALTKKVKEMMGTPGSDKYKKFLDENSEAIYKFLPQSIMNKSFQDFTDEIEVNLSPTRVDEEVEKAYPEVFELYNQLVRCKMNHLKRRA